MRKTKNVIKLSDVKIEEAMDYYGIKVIPHTIDDDFTVVYDEKEENWRVNMAELQNMMIQIGMMYAIAEFRGELKGR